MRLSIMLLVICFCMTPLLFAAPKGDASSQRTTAGQAAQMPFMTGPKVLQIVGGTRATLAPARYPSFYEYQSDNPTCGDYLRNTFTDTDGDDVADTGLSLAPICLQSRYGNNSVGGTCLDYVSVPGLSKRNFEIPEGLRKTGNVLVTWTIRVEGEITSPYSIRPNLCGAWEGTSYQSFPGGVVKSYLYVNGRPKGQEAVMTLPSGGNTSITQITPPPPPPPRSPPDPTHTGSYLITPQDFGGELPARMDIDIYWKNDTCMAIVSPENMRSLIITLIPVGSAKE